MFREHSVPLSRRAIEVIEHIKDLFGDNPQVFPSMMSGKTLLSENPMNPALYAVWG